MPRRVSGKRYAQAIFELAAARHQLDQWAEDLDFADESLQHEEFLLLLRHASIPISQKIKAIDAVLQGVDPLVKNLVALLVSRGSIGLVDKIRLEYRQLLYAHHGWQPVEVTSAIQLSSQELDRITRLIAGLVHKEVIVSAQLDESILGGLIIQIGDQLLDGSTRSKLEALRRRIRSDVTLSGV